MPHALDQKPPGSRSACVLSDAYDLGLSGFHVVCPYAKAAGADVPSAEPAFADYGRSYRG